MTEIVISRKWSATAPSYFGRVCSCGYVSQGTDGPSVSADFDAHRCYDGFKILNHLGDEDSSV